MISFAQPAKYVIPHGLTYLALAIHLKKAGVIVHRVNTF